MSVIEELTTGPLSRHLGFVSRLSHTLCLESKSVSPGPSSYFTLESTGGVGDSGGGIDCPSLPQPPGPYKAGNGWSFSCWFRLSPPPGVGGGTGTSGTSGSGGVRGTPSPLGAIQLARFTSAAGGGLECEITLTPLDPARHTYTLGVRVVSYDSGVAGFGSGKRTSSVDAKVALSPSTWYHMALCHTSTRATGVVGEKLQKFFSKPPRCSIYLDGRQVLDGDIPCPSLPFARALFGRGMAGALAHLCLYSLRLPHTHVTALCLRGPNTPTLHHTLALPPPSAAPHDIRRAGLTMSASLDCMHEGLSMSPSNLLDGFVEAVGLLGHGGGGGGKAASKEAAAAAAAASAKDKDVGDEKLAQVPPLLLHLDAATVIPLPREQPHQQQHAQPSPRVSAYGVGVVVSPLEGTIVLSESVGDACGGDVPCGKHFITGQPSPSHASAAAAAAGAGAASASATPSIKPLLCEVPLSWGRGEGEGEAAFNLKKSLGAIVPLQTKVGPLMLNSAMGVGVGGGGGGGGGGSGGG